MYHPTKTVEVKCQKCGTSFTKPLYGVRLYCSRRCWPKTGPKRKSPPMPGRIGSAREWAERRRLLVEEQNGVCAVCGKDITSDPNLDHDHELRVLRGALCRKCNAGLGLFGDKLEGLQQAVAYLEAHERRQKILTWRGPMLPGWIEQHKKYQLKTYGVDLDGLSEDDRVKYIDDMLRAAMLEIAEAYNELSWKSWAKSTYINRDALSGELVDVIIFLGNALAAAGASTDSVNDKYLAKMSLNGMRQLYGYDGLTGKCPKCKRALDDTAVTCTPELCSEEA